VGNNLVGSTLGAINSWWAYSVQVRYKATDLTLSQPTPTPQTVTAVITSPATITATPSVSVVLPASASSSETSIHTHGLSTGAIAGIGAGGGVGALLALGALLFLCCRRRIKRTPPNEPQETQMKSVGEKPAEKLVESYEAPKLDGNVAASYANPQYPPHRYELAGNPGVQVAQPQVLGFTELPSTVYQHAPSLGHFSYGTPGQQPTELPAHQGAYTASGSQLGGSLQKSF
jgi:hypothetical protein